MISTLSIRSKKADLTFVRNVIIGLILLVVLFLVIAIASGQAGRWIDYLTGLLKVG